MELQLQATSGDRPLSLEQVKRYVRQSSTHDDILLDSLIDAAVNAGEGVLGRSLMAHTFICEVDEHEGVIELPAPPHDEIDKVEYWDGDDWVELEEYYVLGLNSKKVYISTSYQRVRVEFTTTPYLNADVNRGLLELIAVWYDNRPDVDELESRVLRRIAKHKVLCAT
jgi:hypothetical protein